MKFDLGRVVLTSAAAGAVPLDAIIDALRRHVAGDWGELDADDRETNERALATGNRLLSAYSAKGQDGSTIRFWIITEADRSITTVLLPSDY